MKRAVVVAVVVVAILTLAIAASAQVVKPNIIKAGGTWPTKSEVRDATDSLWLYLGYERIVAEMPDSRSDVTVEIGWTKGSGEVYGSPNYVGAKLAVVDEVEVDGRIIPVLVNWRQHAANDEMASTGFFYGIGAGAYFLKGEADGYSESKTKFGLAPFVGIEGENWQGELKYNFVGKFEGIRVDNLLLTFGYRF